MLAAALVFGVIIGTVPAAFGGWLPGPPELVSADPQGLPGNEDSRDPAISADGRYVAFDSEANLVPEDTNRHEEGDRDVYLRDTWANTTTLITGDRTGATDNDRGSRDPSISDDGRSIVFFTGQDLVPSDTNGGQDIYLYDTVAKQYTRIDWYGDGSALGDSIWQFGISGDGEWVWVNTYADLLPEDTDGSSYTDVYLWERATGDITLATESRPGASRPSEYVDYPTISDDGRYVGFSSYEDFVADDTNNGRDLYVRDMTTGEYTRADVWGDGSAADDIWDLRMSGDGSTIVFETWEDYDPDDPGRRDVYAWDRLADELTWISRPMEGAPQWDRGSREGRISDDARYISFFSGKEHAPDDVNGDQDLYIYDSTLDEYRRVDLVSAEGSAGRDLWDWALSGDGGTIAFTAEGVDFSGYEQVYVRALMPVLADGSFRAAGSDRYHTAILTSKQVFPNGADTVVIATGENWPDALGGSSLAGVVRGPILLTQTNVLPPAVKAEIKRLGAKDCYILGGEVAVSKAVENELEVALPGYVYRLGGPDRYDTSKLITNRVINMLGGWYDGGACVATGDNFPDALAGAPLASGLGWPILLANPANGAVYMPADVDKVVILGGTKVVSTATEGALKTKLGAGNVVRKGGSNRYHTAALVAQYGVDSGLNWNGVGIATGELFPDALSGGAALGMLRTVLLLTPTATLDPRAEAALTANKDDISSVHFFGGTSAVSAAVEARVKMILGL
jgi:putative cell wall-binding protein/Tol biopolymer transport system component